MFIPHSWLFHYYLLCTLHFVRTTEGAMLATFAQKYHHRPRNSAKLRQANLDSTCNSLQVSAGNVSHNSLVLRCTSHLHLEGKEEIKRWLMEELIQLHFQPWLCSLCTQYWPFSPVLPSSSILKTHTHKRAPETRTGVYWVRLAASTLTSSWSPLLQCFDFDLQHTQKFYFLLLFAIPFVLCPSCVATLLHHSSCLYARFRPTTEVPYNTNIISSLILDICVKTRMQKKKMPKEV